MARIVGPFGIKGWVKLKTFTEAPDGLLDYPVWWLNVRTGWSECAVAEAEWHSTGLVARLAGYDDRAAAEALKGIEVGIPRHAFPETGVDEYYWTDLIGLTVVNRQNEVLGTIEELLETGANDVLVVRDGDKERLIPYIDAVIVGVDLVDQRIVVDWGVDY